MSGRVAKVDGFRMWCVAGVAAVLGWLLVVLLLVVGARPLGWVALLAAAVTLAAAMLYARIRALQASLVGAFSFAFMVLSWPLLGLVTLVVVGSAGGG